MSPERTEKAARLAEKYGGEVKSVYALLGEKDLVVIAGFAGSSHALKYSIALSRLTGIAFTTSEAIPVGDFDRMIADL